MSEQYIARGSALYRGFELIGIMTTPEQATGAADSFNRLRRWREIPSSRDLSLPQTCQDADGNEVEPADCQVKGPHYVKHPEVVL